MQRILIVFFVTGLVLMSGCAQESAEEAAKNFVDSQIAKHKGFELDTSKLTYKLVGEETDAAKVVVSGNIVVNGEIPMVKEAGKWVVSTQPAQPAAPEKKAAPAVASGHKVETKPAKAPAH